MKTLNIIIANAPVYNGNRGCVALSISSMFIINDMLSKKNILCKFYLPQSGYNEYKEYEVMIGNKVLKYTAIPDISDTSLKSKIKRLFKIKRFLDVSNIYKHADYIFDIGQGDSFSDIYGKKRFEWIFSQHKLGRKYNKPYCILPQTIGPFSSKVIEKQAIKGIEWAKCVMVRDKQSFDYVKEMLPNKEVHEIIDVAFFMPYVKKVFDSSFIHVGLNISALLWHGGYTRDNQFGLKSDYQQLIKDIIKYFLSLNNVKLHLIPHVVGGERSFENDYAVSYDLYEEFHHPNLILAPLFLDPIIAKGYIAGMDFFMGARMHSTIAAFSSGVPVVPMAYSRKFNGLFGETLKYPFVSDMKTQVNENILLDIKNLYAERCKLQKIIDECLKKTVLERKKLLIECLINVFDL